MFDLPSPGGPGFYPGFNDFIPLHNP